MKKNAQTASMEPAISIRRHLLAGAAAATVLVFGVGGWATTTEFAGAVVAPGSFVVESNVKKVQHPTGGVVGELRVRDGDKVVSGEVVVRLDETITRANLSIVTKQLDELYAREARLRAERDDADTLTFPPGLLERAQEPELAQALENERKLFEHRRASRDGQKAQLRERVAQLREEIEGLARQSAAKTQEIEATRKELESVRFLWGKNLVQIQRITGLERDAAKLAGEQGQIAAATAQAKGKITETELQILQVDQDLRSEVAGNLRDTQAKIAEMIERKVTAEDQLRRIDIRAPQTGMVHQLAVHTIGGVIGPGEPIMVIVPEADALTVEAKVAPQDIDQLHIGQPTMLRLSAFNQRTTPEIMGTVSRISADLSTDPHSGAKFYTVRIALPKEELARIGDLKLIPGMPVETFIQTGTRTVLSYLTKPLTDQVSRAFREE